MDRVIEAKGKYDVLIQQITNGLKDNHLDVLQSNADRIVCYSVWKAVDERRKQIRLEKKGIKVASYVKPNVTAWIKVGAHTEADIPCIESVGRMLDILLTKYPSCQDLETFVLANIRCDTLAVQAGSAQSEAYTEIGESPSHTVSYVAGLTPSGTPYWRVCISSKHKHIGVTYDSEEEAIQSTLEVIVDECLL